MLNKRVEIQQRGSAEDRATLARLVKDLPLTSVLNIVGSMLSDRQDLDGMAMQEFLRKVNDLTWPLITTDHSDDMHKRRMR